MSKLFMDIITAFREYAENVGKEKELFPEIIKAVSQDEGVCENFDDEIFVITTENVKQTADNVYKIFYESPNGVDKGETKENVVFDCRSCKYDGIRYFDYLFAYKKKNFDGGQEERLKQSNGKTLRCLLNEYIINFQPKTINTEKNLWLTITPYGEFIAVKKIAGETILCNLSTNERILFNFLCFIEIHKFIQSINGVRDFNYQEKPLIIINFAEFLDAEFDYISFLIAQQLNRKIIIISETNVPKTSH